MANSKNITFDQLQSALTRVKNSLDKKANTSHGNHVPKTETANNARFLRNDNTWQTITPVNIGAADRSHNHTSLTGVTSLQFAAASSDHATIKVTASEANTYLDFEMDDDAGADMFRWRFNVWNADTSAATGQFNLMTLTAKDTSSARLTVNGDVTASSFSGNATSATKLQSARALKIGNTSKNFDGTGNVTWTLSEIGAAPSSHGTHVTYATAVPLADGTAAVGTSSKVAREDHVHPIQTTVTGNAGTATKLATARTLTIGNKGKTFDGSANVTWTLSEIGAAATGHTHNKILSRGKVAAETTTTRPSVDGISMTEAYDNGYPTTYGNVITLKGQGDGQILVGWSGNSGEHAPVYVRSKRDVADANWSGWAQFYTSANPQTSVSGNAGTATKLQTGRSFTIGNTSRTFDGSANVAWSLNDIGAAALSHTHNYVPLSNNSTTKIVADSDASNTDEYAQLQAGHNYLRVTSSGGGGTVTQGADKLTFNGNVVYHAGRKPTPAEIGAATSSHTHSSIGGFAVETYNLVGNNVGMSSVSGNGYAFWAGANGADNSVSAPFKVGHDGSLYAANATLTGTLTGNATTATKLQTARTLTIGNTGKAFDGSGNVSWTLSEIGAAASSHGHSNMLTFKSNHAGDWTDATSMSGKVYMGGWHGNITDTTKDKGYISLALGSSKSLDVHLDGDYYANENNLVLNTGNYKSYVTPANIGAANASHGTHVTYGGNGSATTVSRSDHTHSYIPLSGSASITGNLEFSNSGTTVRGVIGTMGDNDHWRIVGGATASNSGYLEIATADDASEPIYVRQYGNGKFGTLTRTATLLDASGNTSFPGTVTASGFSGNATSATRLQTARTLTIGNTGKNFDGSGNVSWSLSEIGAASSGHTHNQIQDGNSSITIAQANDRSGLDEKNNINLSSWYGVSISNGCSNTDNYGQVTFSVDARSGQVWTRGTVNAPGFSGALYGNANTATTLANSRKFTIGNTERYFNGSADVSWSLSDIGAAASNHTHGLVNLNSEAFSGGNDLNTYNSTKTWVARTLNSTTNKPADYFTVVNFGANSNSNFQLAHSYANNSTLYVRGRHDTSGNYTPWAKIYTDKNKPTADEIGAPSKTGSGASGTWGISVSGNAASATKLQNARTLTIGNTGKEFDGSNNVSWSLDEMGVTSAIQVAENDAKMDIRHNYVTKHEVAHYFEGENKWKLDLYNLGSMSTAATPTKDLMIQHNCQYLYSILVEHPSYMNAYGDTYVGYATTYMHFTEAYQWTGQVATDDSGSVYLNDALVAETTTCQIMDITLNFTAGWNKLEVLYAEGVGGDGWQFTPEIVVVPGGIMDKMNCYGQNSIGERLNGSAGAWDNAYNRVAEWAYGSVGGSATINGDKIQANTITANKLSTIGGFQVEDRLLRGRNGTEGNNYVGMSGDGFEWAFWAGAYNGADAPFHVGHEGHLYATNATLAGTLDGNATTATRLQNARTLTIGNTGKNFDGTGNISWSLDEIGAAPSSHGHNFMYVKGTNTIGSINDDTTSNWGAQGNSVHWYGGVEGMLHDQPSSWGYLLNIGHGSEVHQLWMTQASGNLLHRGGNGSGWSGSWKTILDSDNYSTYAAAKNHTHNYAASSHTHNYAGSSSAGGNANAAVKLATARSINGTNFDGSGNITTANWGTARTITIGGTGKSVNGSGNVSWSLSEIGALPTAGGTVSGNLNVTGAFSIGGKKITINSSAPSSPAVGDIWIKI